MDEGSTSAPFKSSSIFKETLKNWKCLLYKLRRLYNQPNTNFKSIIPKLNPTMNKVSYFTTHIHLSTPKSFVIFVSYLKLMIFLTLCTINQIRHPPAMTMLISSTHIFIRSSQVCLLYHPLWTKLCRLILSFKEHEVFNGLSSLNVTKAMGIAGLGPSLLL